MQRGGADSVAYSLFVGLSGPVGYDYFRGGERPYGEVKPNPVLEDITGLLLCYENLIFLSEDFCPEDLRELPYVSFLTDDADKYERAATAYAQAEELKKLYGKLPYGSVQKTFTRITTSIFGTPEGIDNHTRRLELDGFNCVGNSADTSNIFTDRMIAKSLELSQLDVLTNSVASEAMRSKVINPSHSETFNEWQIDVASAINTLQFPNKQGPCGGYDENIEKLRSNPSIRDFRRYLRGLQPLSADPQEMAEELYEVAREHASKLLQKRYRESSPLYKTIGRFGLSLAGSVLLPQISTAASAIGDATGILKDTRDRKNSAWTAFVLAAKS